MDELNTYAVTGKSRMNQSASLPLYTSDPARKNTAANDKRKNEQGTVFTHRILIIKTVGKIEEMETQSLQEHISLNELQGDGLK